MDRTLVRRICQTPVSKQGLPLHNLNSVYEGGGYKYEGIKYYTGQYKERHIVKPGELIVANTEQGFDYLLIGCSAIIPKRFGEFGIFTHHLFRVKPLPASSITPHFLYLRLKNAQFRSEVTSITNGTTVNMLSPDGLKQPLIAVPPREVMDRFESIVTPIFEQMELTEF